MTTQHRWAPETLRACIRHALASEGVPADIAVVEAEVMTEADLLGVPSHGIAMLPRLVTGLRDGRCTRHPQVRLVREHGATCVLDADNGPGRFASVAAMHHAVERARRFGIGMCLARRTTHWGRAHAYAWRAAQAGMIGLCTTNAIPTMMIPGRPRAVLGNNPLAISVPRGVGRDPVVLDLAVTQAALGKVGTHAREGLPIPEDWGADATGQPTRDPTAVLASGLLLPMGGHKGVGLAVMMELLTAAVLGGPFGHEIASGDATGLDPQASKTFIALDPTAVSDSGTLGARVDALIDYLHDLDPDRSTRFPGERGWLTRLEYERDGIPIHASVLAQLEAVGVTLPGGDVPAGR